MQKVKLSVSTRYDLFGLTLSQISVWNCELWSDSNQISRQSNAHLIPNFGKTGSKLWNCVFLRKNIWIFGLSPHRTQKYLTVGFAWVGERMGCVLTINWVYRLVAWFLDISIRQNLNICSLRKIISTKCSRNRSFWTGVWKRKRPMGCLLTRTDSFNGELHITLVSDQHMANGKRPPTFWGSRSQEEKVGRSEKKRCFLKKKVCFLEHPNRPEQAKFKKS